MSEQKTAKQLANGLRDLFGEVERLRTAYDNEHSIRNRQLLEIGRWKRGYDAARQELATAIDARDGARRRIAELSTERDALRDERDRMVKSPLRQALATMTEDRDALAEGVRAYREAVRSGFAFGANSDVAMKAGEGYRAWERKHGHRADKGTEQARKSDEVPVPTTYLFISQAADPKPTPPPLLDLSKLPVGTVCEAVAELDTIIREHKVVGRFTIAEHDRSAETEWTICVRSESSDLPVAWVRALQPARVISTPKFEEPYRAGLPALALRRVCREWGTIERDKSGTTWLMGRNGIGAANGNGHVSVQLSHSPWERSSWRPHARTWTEVEHDAARMLGKENRQKCACGREDCPNGNWTWLRAELGITDARNMTSLWAAFQEGQKS